MSTRERHLPRVAAVMREGEQVTPLELFFDLVFVLALTQCTTLMSGEDSWEGLLKGLLVLGMLWWSWVGYAWLTSVVDPEEGTVRLVMFLAMAAFLIAALCVPGAFGSDALAFAIAYAVVRVAHIMLFVVASREDPELRHSVVGLALSTAVGAGLLLVAAFTGGALQLSLWGLALVLDAGGPLVIEVAGWRLVPGHFAERHGAIVIIALGESIVAIGVGAHERIDVGIVGAAVLALVLAACLWWAYFDVSSIVAGRFLERAAPGREQNGLARDSYSYLHFPMVAGIGLLAVGLKQTLAGVSGSLSLVSAAALLGGTALFLLAQFAFRLRTMRTLGVRRLLCAVALLAALPLYGQIPAIGLLGIATGLLVAMILYEALRYADVRDRVRHRVVQTD
ncbi:MAG TPA: low temperature requirement protein A [Solirubrobacteraceae bacterium]|jgi:low temperature requirement protein LtrA|nr:low temperature requirement protein A [Solirubrobacteraceae bacterium]